MKYLQTFSFYGDMAPAPMMMMTMMVIYKKVVRNLIFIYA